MTQLTRKEFYEFSIRCHEDALEFARHDQSRVHLAHCRRFNHLLVVLKKYDLLAPQLDDVAPARPINRWMLMAGAGLVWLSSLLFFGHLMEPVTIRLLTLGFMGTAILLFFLPERIYGTTIELLEGKLLRIVEALEELLFSGRMDFSEAAFFQVKENLVAARRELRQQIHLAHQ